MLVADDLLRRSYREIRGLQARIHGGPTRLNDHGLDDEIRDYLEEFDVPLEADPVVAPLPAPENRRRVLHIDTHNAAYTVDGWLNWIWHNINQEGRCRDLMNMLEAIHLAASEDLAICRQIGMALANHEDNPARNINTLLNNILLRDMVDRHINNRGIWLFRKLGIFRWKPKRFTQRLNHRPFRFVVLPQRPAPPTPVFRQPDDVPRPQRAGPIMR